MAFYSKSGLPNPTIRVDAANACASSCATKNAASGTTSRPRPWTRPSIRSVERIVRRHVRRSRYARQLRLLVPAAHADDARENRCCGARSRAPETVNSDTSGGCLPPSPTTLHHPISFLRSGSTLEAAANRTSRLQPSIACSISRAEPATSCSRQLRRWRRAVGLDVTPDASSRTRGHLKGRPTESEAPLKRRPTESGRRAPLYVATLVNHRRRAGTAVSRSIVHRRDDRLRVAECP